MRNIYADGGLDGFQRSYDWSYDTADRMRRQRAMRAAGERYAGGDVSGAAQGLARGGYVDEARTLNQDQAAQEQQTYQRGRQAQQDTRQAEQDKIAMAAKQLDFVQTAGKGIMEQIPMPPNATPEQQQAVIQQRYAVLQKMRPLFDHLGFEGDTLGQITPEQLTDEGLAAVIGQAAQHEQQIKLMATAGGDIVAVDMAKAQAGQPDAARSIYTDTAKRGLVDAQTAAARALEGQRGRANRAAPNAAATGAPWQRDWGN